MLNATSVRTENDPDSRRRGWPARAGHDGTNSLPGGHSEREPPDPIPNSEVKTLCADGSVPFRHARVGHCQALNGRPRWETSGAFSFVGAPDHGGCAGCGALASAAKPTGTFYLRRRSALPARAIG